MSKDKKTRDSRGRAVPPFTPVGPGTLGTWRVVRQSQVINGVRVHFKPQYVLANTAVVAAQACGLLLSECASVEPWHSATCT